MMKIGGRQDVFVQWFSREFMDQHKELFHKITLQPGEALFTIKDGKIGDVVTESTKDVLPGFLSRLKELIVGKKDIQLLVVDLKARMVQIPLSGYTKDRTEIKGVANLMVKVARENVFRVINMFPRGLKSDSKWDDNTQVKEVCEEDISGFFEYDTSVTIDSYVFTKWDAADIRNRSADFVGDITSCINEMMPHWSRMGLDVTVNSVDMQQNSYEDVMKFKNAMTQKQMIEDIKFASQHNDMGNVASLEKERIRLQKTVDLEKLVSKIELEDTELKADLNRNLMIASNDVEKIEIELKGELAKATTAAEIRKITGFSDLDVKKAEEELKLYTEKERNEIIQSNADRDLERILRLKNNSAQLEYDAKVAEIRAECLKQVSAAEAAVERSYNEGYNDGAKEAGEEKYKLGYAEGRAASADSQFNNINQAVWNTANALKQQPPAYYPPQGYAPQGYAPAPQGYAPQGYQQPPQGYAPQGYQQQPPAQQAVTKTCRHCGKQIAADAKFCLECGNPQ